MKKQLFACIALILIGAASLSGCMNRGNVGNVQPTPSPDYMPQGIAAQTRGPEQNSAAFDWNADTAQVEARIRQISEISDVRVVTVGDTALVGVVFDRAYRGDMTERIREMVAKEIMAADPRITTVAVTADDDDVEEIYELSRRSLAGRELDSLKDDISEIVRNATTLR